MDIAADLIVEIAHRHSSAQQILVEKDDFMVESRMGVEPLTLEEVKDVFTENGP